MSAFGGGHPETLLWYAGNRLSPDEAGDVERHLSGCGECEAELKALQSMMRSIRGQARVDHVPSEDLIAFHDGDPAIGESRRHSVREHLRECRGCSEDLDRIRRAGRVEQRLLRGAAWTSPRRLLTHAALVIVLVGASAWGIARLAAPTSSAPEGERIVFAPSQRGNGGERRLQGSGPWRIEVLLPFRAPRSTYRARIQRADGAAEVILETVLVAAPDGSAELVPPGLMEPGHYLLTLEPRDGVGDGPYMYGFDVVAAPRWGDRRW